MWKRVLVIMLGTWLVFSAFAWPHAPPQAINAGLVGAGLIVFGALSYFYRWARAAVVALAVWLFVFTILGGPATRLTFWNNGLCALVVFVLGMLDEHIVFHTRTPSDQVA
jgi:hypothetical protein